MSRFEPLPDYHVETLCRSCRVGDIKTVRKLIGMKVESLSDLNSASCMDKFGNSPLYLACLCGHVGIVEFLLESGAEYDPRTIEGQRCRLAALHVGIRAMLRKYSVVVVPIQEQWESTNKIFLQLMNSIRTSSEYHDITLTVSGEHAHAHRCLLMCHGFFIDQLNSGQQNLDLTGQVRDITTLNEMLDLICTGYAKVETDNIFNLQTHLTVFNLEKLRNLVMDAYDAYVRKFQMSNPQGEPRKGTVSVGNSKHTTELRFIIGEMARRGIPGTLLKQEDLASCNTGEGDSNCFYDVCFQIDDYIFYGHKVFFATQSEYFAAVLKDPFSENSEVDGRSGKIQYVRVNNFTPRVFVYIMIYIYTLSCEPPMDILEDVLLAADLIGLKRLKECCANIMMNNLDFENVISCYKLAGVLELPHLRNACIRKFAVHTPEICSTSKFGELLKEEAKKLDERHKELPIIQSILDYIKQNIPVAGIGDEERAIEKVRVLNQALIESGLQRFKIPLPTSRRLLRNATKHCNLM